MSDTPARLFCLSLNFRLASAERCGAFAMRADAIAALLRELVAGVSVLEAAALSTCQRR